MSLTTILFLGAGQAAFLVALIASKKNKGLPDWILATLAPASLHVPFRHRLMSGVTLFIYAVGYFGWRQFAVVEADRAELEASPGEPETTVERPAKYERSGLKTAETEALVSRLEAHLEQDRPPASGLLHRRQSPRDPPTGQTLKTNPELIRALGVAQL